MSDLLSRMIRRATLPTAGIVPVTPSIYEGVSYSPGGIAMVSNGSRDGAGKTPFARPVERQQKPAGRARGEGELRHPQAASETEQRRAEHWPAEQRPPAESAARPPAWRSEAEESTGLRASAQHEVFEADEPVGNPARLTEGRGETIESLAQVEAPVRGARIFEQPAQAPALRGREESVRIRPQRQAAASGSGVAEQPVEVHVSIGHIEIRQAAPPPPPPPHPAPVVHVRLEDYLKRRGGTR